MNALLGVRQVTCVCGNAKNPGIRIKILRYFHCGERSPKMRCVGIKVRSSSHVGSHKAISNKPWQSFLFPLCTGSIQQGHPVTTWDGSKGIAQAPGIPLNNNNIAKFASSPSISTSNSASSSPTLASAPTANVDAILFTFPKVGGVSPADSQCQPSPVVPSPVVPGPTVVVSKTQAPAGAKSGTSPGDRFGHFKYFTDK
ncbi:hypothetical protein DPMN_005000 [Dreissena polymorpha]|uniref:Uncharacterized protein n=1 Tax=Dreissena polymorpha TaxID=45954 RepID=A0A9D4MRC5_DREPO|nr:hypothetical protein DPMN_005000 [Dreissena polymorpha]